MFKRNVQIADLGTEGISLKVIFNILPSSWPSLKTAYQSVGGGRGENELLIYSPRFKLVSEARKWLDELTEEMKTLCILDKELTDLFRTLEGEEII